MGVQVPSRAVLIFNPKSGKGKATHLAKYFAEQWKKFQKTELWIRPTTSVQDLKKAATDPIYHNRIKIFMGGDGTFSIAMSALFKQNQFKALENPVAFLPAGTGNSFLRDFKIHSFEDACKKFFAAKKPIPLSAVFLKCFQQDAKPFECVSLNIVGTGIIPKIADFAHSHRYLGHANYTVGTLFELTRHKMQKVKLTFDKNAGEDQFDFIAICNSAYTGGKMMMAPNAHARYGHVEIVLPKIKSRIKMLRLFPLIFSGKHVELSNVQVMQARTFSVEFPKDSLVLIDGELSIAHKIQGKVMPASWKLWLSSDDV